MHRLTGKTTTGTEKYGRRSHASGPGERSTPTTAGETLNDPLTATPSDSLEADEEPPAKTLDLSQSSSSDYSDSEDTDSEDTPEETFQRIIPAGRKGGTNFDNVRDI